jgi:hypothetical protein
MDELFFIPATAAALPRAYWLENPALSSQIMLIQPSAQNSERVQKAITQASGEVYDMEIVNKLFGNDCVVLPHRRYDLLTGEFRQQTHEKFLEENERWDPERVIKEAKFVHFSDDPFPKPWLKPRAATVEKMKPACFVKRSGKEDCRARDIWLDLYADFKERRKVGVDSLMCCRFADVVLPERLRVRMGSDGSVNLWLLPPRLEITIGSDGPNE